MILPVPDLINQVTNVTICRSSLPNKAIWTKIESEKYSYWMMPFGNLCE